MGNTAFTVYLSTLSGILTINKIKYVYFPLTIIPGRIFFGGPGTAGKPFSFRMIRLPEITRQNVDSLNDYDEKCAESIPEAFGI